MKRRQDQIHSISLRLTIWGAAPILFLAFTGIGAAQPATIPRQNEKIASSAAGDLNSFMSSMKEMRQRAQDRYEQNMRQINQQIQAYQQKQNQQATLNPAAPHTHQPGSAPGYSPNNGEGRGFQGYQAGSKTQPNRQPQAGNKQQNPLSIFQQLFGTPDNSGPKSGFPQQAQAQPKSGFAPQQPPQTAVPQHNHNHNGQDAQMTPQQQQQAWLMQQRMQAQAAVQQAREAAPQPKPTRRGETSSALVYADAQRMAKSEKASSSVSVDQLSKASTSQESAAEVVSQVPWNAISPAARQRAEKIVSSYTFYRRLPMTGGYCNPEIYDYLVCHPEVVVGTWEAGGFKQLSLANNGGGRFTLKDNSGTRGEIEIVYHDNKMLAFLCNGVYEGQLSPRPIQGDIFCVMQYRFTEDAANGNKPIVVTRLDTFVRMSSASADLVGKAFAPMVGKIADSNFVKTVDSVNQISELMERNPQVLAEMIQEVPSISTETKKEFLGYIERVTGHASMRSQGITVDYYLMPKMNVAKAEPAEILARRNQPTRMTVVNEPQVRPANAPSSTAMPAPSLSASKSSMPTPSLAASKSPSVKSSEGKSSRNESMPFPSASSRKSSVAKSESKSDLPAVGGQTETEIEKELNSVLSEGETLVDFSLNDDSGDDSQELFFSDDLSPAGPEEKTSVSEETASKADDSTGGELSFDLESDDSGDSASDQTIVVAKPISEAPSDSEPEAEESDGWNAVIISTDSASGASNSAVKTVPNSGQKCSWKKPDVK